MKASPIKQQPGSKDIKDRAPRALSAGKSSAAPSKGSSSFKQGMLTPKQTTSTGTAKKPQKL